LWLVAAAVLLLLVGAWAVERFSSGLAGSADETPYSVSVVVDGETIKRFTLDDLESLKSKRVVMQGQPEEGPPVLTVLSAAGVSEFDSLMFVGMKVRDGGILILPRDEVSGDVLLDIAKRGTAKVCGPEIPQESRVRDVIRIEVSGALK